MPDAKKVSRQFATQKTALSSFCKLSSEFFMFLRNPEVGKGEQKVNPATHSFSSEDSEKGGNRTAFFRMNKTSFFFSVNFPVNEIFFSVLAVSSF